VGLVDSVATDFPSPLVPPESRWALKRTGKGDAAWYGSGDCYGIYYDSKGESHRVYCGSWEEELRGKYYKARD
jgi:hypothetical protein